MNTAQKLFNKLQNKQFSYGESLSMILEENGKALTSLPNEDFVFPDNSIIRVTNNNIKVLEVLVE